MTSAVESGAQVSEANGLPAAPLSVSCVSLPSLSRSQRLFSLTNAVHLPSGDAASRFACGGWKPPPPLSPFFFCCGASSSSNSPAQGGSSSWSASGGGGVDSIDSSSLVLAAGVHSYDDRSHCQPLPPAWKRSDLAASPNSMVSNGKCSARYAVPDAFDSAAATF